MKCEYCLEEFTPNESKTCCDICYNEYEKGIDKGAKSRELYWERRESGLCVLCGKVSDYGCRCKKCNDKYKEYSVTYREKHKQKIKDYMKEYRKKNRKRLNEYSKELRNSNIEYYRAKAREKYKKNKEDRGV